MRKTSEPRGKGEGKGVEGNRLVSLSGRLLETARGKKVGIKPSSTRKEPQRGGG